jgi:hypothetical protein
MVCGGQNLSMLLAVDIKNFLETKDYWLVVMEASQVEKIIL